MIAFSVIVLSIFCHGFSKVPVHPELSIVSKQLTFRSARLGIARVNFIYFRLIAAVASFSDEKSAGGLDSMS